jgi:BlaI family transcriptional regulator, penicillinase repressor
MPPRAGPTVTDAELRVLDALWRLGPCPIRKLTDDLYPDGTAAHYATVQKLLERLETEKCVRRDRSAMTHVFTATVSRDELIGGMLRSLADRMCGGSLAPLLTQLLSAKVTDDQRRELRKLLDARKPTGR